VEHPTKRFELDGFHIAEVDEEERSDLFDTDDRSAVFAGPGALAAGERRSGQARSRRWSRDLPTRPGGPPRLWL
jgi:hypothetical protein